VVLPDLGATLVLVGLLGFLAEAKFDTSAGGDPGALDGENFLIFEVNGWHNIVHIASGLFLLALAGKHRTARTAALAFGAIYAVVTVIGLIDGHDVLGLIPVNPADNVLHILLTVAALAAGLVSDRDRREVRPGADIKAKAAVSDVVGGCRTVSAQTSPRGRESGSSTEAAAGGARASAASRRGLRGL
jgi:uncharacterized protein DUF4383